jgi:hypothetical protein
VRRSFLNPEISEFSYGFALTAEVAGWASLKAAPIFPTQVQEGRPGGGYDVKLDWPGVPLYLQFKRSMCLERKSAREIRDHNLPLRLPFYRFAITERNRSIQHTSLVALDSGPNLVFYAAPRFHKFEEINEAWSAGSVAQRSVFVSPGTIGLIRDDDSHVLSYDGASAFFCSTPTAIPAHRAADVLAKMQSRLVQERRSLRAALPELVENALGAVEEAGALQAEIDVEIEERRREERMRKADVFPWDPYPVGDTSVGFDGPISGYEPEMGPVPLPSAIQGVDRPELSKEDAMLEKLADTAQRKFGAQLFVAQRRE